MSRAQRPEGGGDEELARVNGEPVTLEEFLYHLGTLHGQVAEPDSPVRGPDTSALLDRIINARLVVQEAQNIGLDDLPEVAAQLATARAELIKQAVIEERLRPIQEGDPKEIERNFRDATREIQVESVLLRSEEAAVEFRRRIAEGGDFQAVAGRMIETGEAARREEPQYHRASRLLPEVARRVVELETGAISEPIALPDGWTVVKLLDVRYADDPEARADAEERALTTRRQLDLGDYSNELRARYATADAELLESLDYDSPAPGLETLAGDERVVVEIAGGEPITVADLTAELKKRFFHGMDRAVARQRVNAEIPGVLDRMILERAVELEARRLGIVDRPEFRNTLRATEEGILFGAFVGKVIDPKVKLSDEELEAYYDANQGDFTTPEMMRLEGLAFERRADAEATLRSLRQGADPVWTREHAPGRSKPESLDADWTFAGQLLPVAELPAAARTAVTGAATGELRLVEQPDGPIHVLRVVEAFPPQPRPFRQVQREISVRLFSQKRQQILDEWLGELRDASEIEILADAARIRSLLGLRSGEGA